MWKHMYIKGHQNDRTPYDDLDIVSQANVDVDLLVKQELSINRPVDDSLVLPGQCGDSGILSIMSLFKATLRAL